MYFKPGKSDLFIIVYKLSLTKIFFSWTSMLPGITRAVPAAETLKRVSF